MIFRLGNVCGELTFGPVLGFFFCGGFLRANLEGISGVLAEEFVACKACPPLLSLFFFFLFSSSLFSPPLLPAGPGFVFLSLPPLLARRSGDDRTAALRLSGLLFFSVFSLRLGRLARSRAPPPLFLPSFFLSLLPSLACRALALHRCFQ